MVRGATKLAGRVTARREVALMQSQSPNHRRQSAALPGRATLLLASLLASSVTFAAEPTQPAAARARIPWTTSQVVGSPDPPPPFKIIRAFPNLKFEHPLLLV